MRVVGIAAKAAVGDDFNFGQQRGERADGGRFCRAAFAANEDAAMGAVC